MSGESGSGRAGSGANGFALPAPAQAGACPWSSIRLRSRSFDVAESTPAFQSRAVKRSGRFSATCRSESTTRSNTLCIKSSKASALDSSIRHRLQLGRAATACGTHREGRGSRAFRRPLTDEEVAGLVTNTAKPASGGSAAVAAAPFAIAGSDTQTGIKLMIEAILLSPSFIYRTGVGPEHPHSGRERKLSADDADPVRSCDSARFTFLGSIPDRELESAAVITEPNGLGTTTGISAQVDQLLKLPAVQQNLTTIVGLRFNVGQLFLKTHDTSFWRTLPAADQMDQTGVRATVRVCPAVDQQRALGQFGEGRRLLATPKGYFNSRLAKLFPDVTFERCARFSTTFVMGTGRMRKIAWAC